jgi:hypothetical protein
MKIYTKLRVVSKLPSKWYQSISLLKHTIVGFANLQKRKDLHPKTRDLYSKYIYDNSAPNLLLLDNVSDLFAIESGQISINYDTCSLNGSVASVQ